MSSSRVYACSGLKLTELLPRLLDSCKDEAYLQTDEYALAKARQENLLINSKRRNWTIIRPYKTYGDYRLQLGIFEKEDWLYRAFCNKPIIFSEDMASKRTVLTFGDDVAHGIYELIGNEQALGEAFHITCDQSATWDDILKIYLDAIEKKTGVRPSVCYVKSSDKLFEIWNPYQIKYDCLYDREFENKKLPLLVLA